MAEPTFIIAEAGVNHNGSIEQAFALVDVAADAGADVVKFQTFKADQLTTARAPRAAYQVANMQEDGTQLAIFGCSLLALISKQIIRLKNYFKKFINHLTKKNQRFRQRPKII